MRRVEAESTGGPEVLHVVERPDPSPDPDQLLVDVRAAGVNYIDTYQRQGVYAAPLPLTLGAEGAGTVRAVGDGVRDFRPGDRVAWTTGAGAYADRCVIAARDAVPIPDSVDDETAAAVLLQGLTAHYLATSTYPISAGDTAVVHAAAGGVGLLLTQIISRRGGRVIATTSTAEKAELARVAGAVETAGYDDFVDAARRATDGRGADVVYDGVGQATFERGLDALRPRGLMALFGGSSGQVPPFNLQVLNAKGSLFVTRPTLVHYIATREELLQRVADLFGWISAGELSVRIGGRYRLEDAGQAHTDLQSRSTTGKLVLMP
jgi:NADPH2:quinone reductase